jgi:hypothetical protein
MSNYILDTNKRQITFLDNRFYQTEDGDFVPSVTTILQAYPKDAHFFQWLKQVGDNADEIRDEAGRRGSIVHSLTEQYDAGEEVYLLDNSGHISFKLLEWAMFERYVEFRNNHQLDVIHSEFNVISKSYGFAGTIDRIIQIDGFNILVDIKTSNMVHDHYWLQLAAYERLVNEYYHSAGVIDKVAILHLNAKTRSYGKNGAIQGPGWQLIIRDEADRANDWELFKSTHKLWLAQNSNTLPKNNQFKISHKL